MKLLSAFSSAAVFAGIVFVLAIAACSGNKPRVLGPPQVLIQELNTQSSSDSARVLIHNYSNIEMNFNRIEYELRFEDRVVAQGVSQIELPIPPDSADSTLLPIEFNPDGLNQLDSNAEALNYQFSGTVQSSDPSRVFEFQYKARLSRTPGKPGAWR